MSTTTPSQGWQPGQVLLADDPIELNAGREVIEVTVVNDGDRPVQVGSHYHFAEANEALRFDRGRTIGFRLAVPAGTSVRFEPGVQRSVELVAYGGDHIVAGFRGLYGGVV